MSQDDPAIDAVLAYHRRAKHHLHRYAASPGSLDWATQPEPVRTFIGEICQQFDDCRFLGSLTGDISELWSA